jgi:hypothetical protein
MMPLVPLSQLGIDVTTRRYQVGERLLMALVQHPVDEWWQKMIGDEIAHRHALFVIAYRPGDPEVMAWESVTDDLLKGRL